MFGRRRRARDEPGRTTTGTTPAPDTELDRWLAQADGEAATNPLAYVTLMGRRLAELTTTSLTDGDELDPQSAVTVLGAMTGLGAQAAFAMGKRSGDPDYATRSDFSLDTVAGDRVLMGDAIAFPLFSAPHSAWNIITTPLRSIGGTPPTPEDLTVRVAQTVGTGAFVVPRLEPGTSVRWLPREALEHCGRALAIQPAGRLPVAQWYMAYAFAAKTVLDRHRDAPETLAALTRVALDSANAMAKDLRSKQTRPPRTEQPAPPAPRTGRHAAPSQPAPPSTPPSGHDAEAGDTIAGPGIRDDRSSRARAMGDRVLDRAVRVFQDDRGLHAETVLTVLGALAGRAAQLAALNGVQAGAPEYEGRVNQVGQGPNGERYAIGDAIQYPLFVARASVYAIVTAPLVDGGRVAPTAEDVRGHGRATMGTPAFELPRFAPGTTARWLPREAVGFGLRTLAIPPIVLPPEQWYVAYAAAAAKFLEMNREHLDIEPLTRVVLDAANIGAALLVTPTADPPPESPRR